MVIFIDEAGAFANPKNLPNYVCCLGGLVFPEGVIDRVFEKFKLLKASWGVNSDEVKGSSLNEQQIASVISLLASEDVIFKAVAIDLGLQSDQDATLQKQSQAKRIRDEIPGSQPQMAKDLSILADSITQISNPLYIQSHLLTVLVDDLFRTSTLYYCQRNPHNLGSFTWVIDAKDKNITPHEKLWQTICRPFLQWISLKKPFEQLAGADYSHFEKFCGSSPKPPEHLAPRIENGDGELFQFIDANMIMKAVQFSDSKEHLGLQLVDILTSSLRRAFSGKLDQSGWGKIGSLMVQPPVGSPVVHFLTMNEGGVKSVPYGRIPEHLEIDAKSMMYRNR